MRVPSYLHRNRHGVYGFRAVIPKRLRVRFAQHEFRLTLGTSRICDAKRLARLLSAVLLAHLAFLPKMSSDDANAQGKLLLDDLARARDQLAKKFLNLAEDPRGIEERREEIQVRLAAVTAEQERLDLLVHDLEDHTPDSQSRRDLASALDHLATRREALALDIVEHASLEEAELQAMLELREKARAIMMTAEHEEIVAKHAANFEQRKGDIKEMMEAALRASASGSVVAPAPRTGELLSKVIADYCDSQKAENRWTEKTAFETKAGIDLWLRIVGDQPITGYGHEQHRNYKATLQKLPPNLNKMPRYRGLSISAIVALGDPPASVNTVGNQLARIAALFNWAVRHGYTGSNPASGMAPKKAKRASEERQAFSDEDLKKLFHGHDYLNGRHREPYMYWTPLIALYTGARLNEIAQLHLADFVTIDGGHAITVNDQGDAKRVKTSASKRAIPIHSELVRLGLVRFVEVLRAKKEARLFPELKLLRDGYGQTVSKWFRRYRLRCGISEGGKVFHSFRHTVIDALKQAGHPKEKISALVGHEDESVTFGRYGKAYGPHVLRGVVDALPFRHISSLVLAYC